MCSFGARQPEPFSRGPTCRWTTVADTTDTDLPARATTGDRPERDWIVGAVGLLVAVAAFLFSFLGSYGGDVTGVLTIGDEWTGIHQHAEEELGQDIHTREGLGHDGAFFFLQALDPLYLEPDEHAAEIFRPIYRAQRMAYPMIAGAGGLTPAPWLPWTMVLTNILAFGLGTAGTARLARLMGGSRWWGLAFALNVGVLFELDISGAGVLAFAAAIWGTVALEEDRPRRAIPWFVLAVLAREVMFLYLAGVLFLRWWRTKKLPFALGFWPALAAVLWAVYIRARLEPGDGVQEFGIPLKGFLGAVPSWMERPVDLVIVVALIVVMGGLVVRSVRSPSYIGWGAIGFVLLAVLLSRQVWWRFFDITRATAPVITAYVLVAFAAGSRSAETERADDTPESTAEPVQG